MVIYLYKSEYFCIKSMGKIQVGLNSFGQFIFHVYYTHIEIIRSFGQTGLGK